MVISGITIANSGDTEPHPTVQEQIDALKFAMSQFAGIIDIIIVLLGAGQ